MNVNKWTEEEILYLKENYETKSYKEMCDYLGRSEKGIKVKASRLNLRKSGLYYDKNLFNNISDNETSYWFGFLCADGWIEYRPRSYSFGLELQISDIEHIKKLNNFIGVDSKIYTRDRKSRINDNIYHSCYVVYSDKTVVDNLIKNGMTPNKSFTIKFPDHIADAYMWDFIRGYFDGNGNLSLKSVNNHEYMRLYLCTASIDFANGLYNFLLKNGFSPKVFKDKSCYKIYINKKNEVKTFFNNIYSDGVTFLNRKHELYLYYADLISDN